jgi:hypothetical protein
MMSKATLVNVLVLAGLSLWGLFRLDQTDTVIEAIKAGFLFLAFRL